MVEGTGRVTGLVQQFLKSGLKDPEDTEAARRIAMCNVISLIGILNVVPLGVAAYLQGNTALGIFDHTVALILIGNLCYLHRTGNVYRASCTGLAIVATLFLFLFATGGVRDTGHLWFYTFPLISAFLLGSYRGALASLILLSSGVVFLVIATGDCPWLRVYESAFTIRFIPSYLVVLAYSYFFERFRERAQRTLLDKNEQLGVMVTELQEKERALELARSGLEVKVTERTADLARANEDLRLSHARFATVMDSMDANVYAADIETHEVLFLNRRMIDVFGGDLVGRKCHEALRGRTEPCDYCTNSRLLDQEGRPTGAVVWEGRNEETGHWYLHHDRAIEWVDGRYVRLQVATDISKRKEAEKKNAQLQEQLLQAQKMEAIGTLAGGVAHDLNNILSAIVGYPDLILMDLPADSPLRGSLLTIKDSGEKCSKIVQDMLTLARRVVSPREPMLLDRLVKKYLQSPEFLRLKMTYPDVEVDYEGPAHLLPVLGSEVHVFKSVMNLVTNAYEAMTAGGKLNISLLNRNVEHPIRGYTLVPPGDYVTLEIADTGTGISREDLPHIFEPFYTRKVMGRSGTGLGMAVVWGTVNDHRGYLDVRSTPGEGTSFVLYFPVSRLEVSDVSAEAYVECRLGCGERILVVDDISEQRDLAETMLTRLGYEVRTVPSGEEALAVLAEISPDLLVLDMIMEPGIDGLETFSRSLAIRPDQRAIITSGFSETDRVAEALRLGAAEYVKKPFLMRELAAAVRRALDRRPAPSTK